MSRRRSSWVPGVPLYTDPDRLETMGAEDIQYVRYLFEFIDDDPCPDTFPEEDFWRCGESAFHWSPSGEPPHFTWLAPIAKRRVKSGKRR